MTLELRATLEAQRIIPGVFNRTKRGRPLKGFTKAWRQACMEAGGSGRIPHDCRRTAVRNLERAGVAQLAAYSGAAGLKPISLPLPSNT